MQLTGTGIWNAGLRFQDAVLVAETVAELEELGYTSLWIPDFKGGVFEPIERLLGATKTIAACTGILNLWMYTPDEVNERCAQIRDTFGDRFMMAIGVSHADMVESVVEDARWEKPLSKMREFLDGLDAGTSPVPQDVRLLGALGPKMLELAAARAGGAHPYNVTPEHTARAREILGPTKLLVPEQAVALVATAEEGRTCGRHFLQHYLDRPNYANNLRRLGFTEDDIARGGSDRLIDALVAWGDETAIAARIQAHRDAGADSVCIQVLTAGSMVDLTIDEWRALAPVLT